MSVFINTLGIRIDSYEHVLGPPRFLFNTEKVIFSHKIRPIFNGLIKKLQNVINDGFRVHFWRGDARFLTQSTHLTQKPTFPKF